MDYTALKDLYGKGKKAEGEEEKEEAAAEEDDARLTACRAGIAERVKEVTEQEVEELVQLLKVSLGWLILVLKCTAFDSCSFTLSGPL